VRTRPPFDDPYEQAIFDAASHLPGVGRIAFDLDDTLLLNSRSLRKNWHANPGTDNMGQELVECAFLPGAFALLSGLREAGNEILLMTASSRRRLNYLFTRLPNFAQFFSPTISASSNPLVACAEDIVEAQHLNAALRPTSDTICLTQKTPDLAAYLFGGISYTLLIDDSDEIYNTLTELGEQDRLVPVKTTVCDATTAWEIIKQISLKLSKSISLPQELRNPTPPTPIPDPYFLADLCCGHILYIGKDLKEFNTRIQ
jgi:hypothetical protein